MLKSNSHLPLFPLDLVLFPGMMLPLHIFEERYKIMIKNCIDNSQPFGVVLAKIKSSAQGNLDLSYFDQMYNVGTTAHITAVEHLQDGRMNLITIGQDRFIIKDIELSGDNFFVGRVDPLPIETQENPKQVGVLAGQLRLTVKRYIGHLAEASGENISDAKIPVDPTALAFLAGAAMQGPLPDKQQLLSATSLTSLIAKAMNVIDREDKILVYMMKAYAAHQQIQRPSFVDYSLN